ncbi:unnamed protein product [Didymodactylos carnosus]|uniref:Uncharacterized protein n=1 Tax=Didymodactylos carnosus TaxID=1234261 RepID=A0A8S2PCH5_9BILA|nr:unnamed protein product [Didymodactylos carnosus]CAF4036665.1 unnamed protein product [Didymodactylos carnosus]
MYNNLDMLEDINIYRKSYKTHSIISTEQKYKLVIFPSDSTFSIVNNKQCSNLEHDGLIIVQSGSKKYPAMVFKEGTMSELHEAQKLLGKAMNTDIESDYDPEQENIMKTKTTTIVKPQSEEPTITSLLDIPFGGLTCKNLTINSQSKNVHSTLGMSKIDAGDSLRYLKQTINNYDSDDCEDLRPSPQRQHSKCTKTTNTKSKRQCTSSSKKSTSPNTTIPTPSIFLIDTQQLEYDDSDYENKLPPRKPSNQIMNQTTPSSSSISILQTPKPLTGRKILGTNDDNYDDNEQPSQKELVCLLKQSLLSNTKIEEKYLKQILIGQERQENMIKMLFENQKKIQKALCKKKVAYRTL